MARKSRSASTRRIRCGPQRRRCYLIRAWPLNQSRTSSTTSTLAPRRFTIKGDALSVRQAQTLLNTPDVSTKKGLRDRAMLAVLLGCGLRRSEVAALTFKHIQQRDGRWCIVDLVGKHGRVRTIPMPTWVKVAIDAWTEAAEVSEGHVLRPVIVRTKSRGCGCLRR